MMVGIGEACGLRERKGFRFFFETGHLQKCSGPPEGAELK